MKHNFGQMMIKICIQPSCKSNGYCVCGTYIHKAYRNTKIRTAFFAPAAVLTHEVLFLVSDWHHHIMLPPPVVLHWHHTADYLASFSTLQTATGILQVQFHTLNM
jgi:hypothetical protein